MQKEEAIREALALANRSGIAMLGTNGDQCGPRPQSPSCCPRTGPP